MLHLQQVTDVLPVISNTERSCSMAYEEILFSEHKPCRQASLSPCCSLESPAQETLVCLLRDAGLNSSVTVIIKEL